MREVPEIVASEAVLLRVMDNALRCEFIPSIDKWGARVKVFEVDGSIGLVESTEVFESLYERGLVGMEFAPNGYNRTDAWITEDGRRALAFYDEKNEVTMGLMASAD